MSRTRYARLDQHFESGTAASRRASSAGAINPDAVRLVRWWEDERFSDVDALHAGALVAFDFFDPALGSRGGARKAAVAKADDPAAFRAEMKRLFASTTAGEFRLPWLRDIDTRLEHRSSSA